MEAREVPSHIVNFTINTLNDTAAVVNPATGLLTPQDANGDYSLRSVVQYADANPQNGPLATNNYTVNLSGFGGQTLTLSSAANFQTISLDANFIFLANTGTVTIARSAAAGTPVFEHFDVAAGAIASFTNFALVNGNSFVSGGSIFNQGTVNFTNCTFVDNTSGVQGGAIATWAGATTSVSGCDFYGNSASMGGGAIAARSESVETDITECQLTENSTAGDGGAVWAQEAGTVKISGGAITDNNATGVTSFGGGVYVEATTNATISQTAINDNTSGAEGGGLYVLNTALTMTGGQLSGNTSAANGGGFYMDCVDLTVALNQVSVTDNVSAVGLGGGGFVEQGTLAGQLGTGQLTGNTAGGKGRNGSLPGIGVAVGKADWTLTVAPGRQTVELQRL